MTILTAMNYPDEGYGPGEMLRIAAKLEQIYPELVVHNADNQPESVQYHELVPVLLKEIQQQRAEISEMKAQLAELKASIDHPAHLASR